MERAVIVYWQVSRGYSGGIRNTILVLERFILRNQVIELLLEFVGTVLAGERLDALPPEVRLIPPVAGWPSVTAFRNTHLGQLLECVASGSFGALRPVGKLLGSKQRL
jgi:hypothetical protein